MIEETVLKLTEDDEFARVAAMNRAWRYYQGDTPNPLKQEKPTDANDNTKPNLVKVVADKTVSWLFGQEVQFTLDEHQEEDPDEKWLASVWKKNRKITMLKKAGMNGTVAGHIFLKLLDKKPIPGMILLDTQNVRVVWNPDNIDEVLAYIIQYTAVRQGRAVVFREVIERDDGKRWQSTEQWASEQSSKEETWHTEKETPWPYEFPPISDCQNLPLANVYYGMADLNGDLLDLQDRIHFILSNIQKIIRHHAHPKTVASGVAGGIKATAPDEVIYLPNPDAKMYNLEMNADLASSISHYRQVKEAFHEMARIPEIATGKLESIGAISGVALRILFQPLVSLTEDKQSTYQELLSETCRRLLIMGGKKPREATVVWPNVVPTDDQVEAQTGLIWDQLGVPRAEILKRLGFRDAEKLLAQRKKNDAEAGLTMLEGIGQQSTEEAIAADEAEAAEG